LPNDISILRAVRETQDGQTGAPSEERACPVCSDEPVGDTTAGRICVIHRRLPSHDGLPTGETAGPPPFSRRPLFLRTTRENLRSAGRFGRPTIWGKLNNTRVASRQIGKRPRRRCFERDWGPRALIVLNFGSTPSENGIAISAGGRIDGAPDQRIRRAEHRVRLGCAAAPGHQRHAKDENAKFHVLILIRRVLS
jgi:hypothetical protein